LGLLRRQASGGRTPHATRRPASARPGEVADRARGRSWSLAGFAPGEPPRFARPAPRV